MSKDPLHIYLAKERANGAYSFSLRVQPPRYIGDTEVRFTIHPELQSGETNDYAVSEDPERPAWDFIYNLAAIPELDVQAFLAMLREQRLLPPNNEVRDARAESGASPSVEASPE